MSIVVPVGNDGGVIEGPDSVDIVSSLYFLNYDFGIFLLVEFGVIVIFGLAEVGPFGEVYAVFIGVVAGTLYCEYLIGIVGHLCIVGEWGIEG